MSETKKMTGIQKPLDISAALAKIIGTKKGEQVFRFSLSWHAATLYFLGVATPGGKEAVGLPEGERPPGSKEFQFEIYSQSPQDKENRQWFTPDKTMEPVFGKERQKCFGMSKHLKEHLTNPDK